MLYNLSNLVANIKSGLKTKKLIIKCNKNNFIKRILLKLIYEGYIRSYSIDTNLNNKIIKTIKIKNNKFILLNLFKILNYNIIFYKQVQ